MWKFQDFSAKQILREINFLGTFDILKCEIFPKIKFKAFKIDKTVVFDLLTLAKIDFT